MNLVLAGLATVILPTYNRAHTLKRALDSLLVQTDPDWVCYVLDDGSTDGTPELATGYAIQDPRIVYSHFPENRGGVAMNEIGMQLACEEGAYWVRLGSDDYFLPSKLALDRLALAEAGACFGPYQNDPPSWDGELNGPQDARAALLQGHFAVSWANIAMRVDVLRQVRAAFGSFVDSRLRNMEDYLFNVRAARFTEFAWRGASADGTRVMIGATAPKQVPFPWVPDARYTVAIDSATYGPGSSWAARDSEMTLVCRGEDHMRSVPVVEVPSPVCHEVRP